MEKAAVGKNAGIGSQYYSEHCAFANLILPSVLYSVEMPSVINEAVLHYIAKASSA